VSNRRDLTRAYKARTVRGAVYTITNTHSGRYLLGYAADVASVRNRFDFAVRTGSAVDPRLRADWNTYGAATFTLAIVEELEKRPDQSQAAFLEDLQTLEALKRAELDPVLAY
jgi:hypothetical protein